MVQRMKHLLGKLGGLIENRCANISRRVAEAWKVVVLVDLKDVVEKEGHVFDGCFVDRHGMSLSSQLDLDCADYLGIESPQHMDWLR